MSRYWKLTKILFRTSVIRDMQFRGAFFADLFSVLLWTVSYIVVIEVLYLHTNMLHGWNRGDLFVLLGIWVIIDDLLGATVWKGLQELPQTIADGKLDFVLIKPVDSQFLLTMRRFYLVRLVTLLAGVALTVYGFQQSGAVVSVFSLLTFMVLLVCGYLLSFSIFMFLETLGFWFLRIDNVWALFDGMQSIAKYPLDVFGRPVKFATLTVVPLFVAFLYPAQALLGRLTWWEIAYAPALTVLFLWLTRKFYQYSVRRYSSVA